MVTPTRVSPRRATGFKGAIISSRSIHAAAMRLRSAWARASLATRHLPRPDPLLLASCLVVLGICSLVGFLVLEARRDAWGHAAMETANMRRLVARDLARNLEVFDLSLRAIAENLAVPGVAELPANIRDMALFNRAVSASHIGSVLATDQDGVVRYVPSSAESVIGQSFADRDYFTVHRDNPDIGLYISRPDQGRITGAWRIMLSRRRNNPDGSFAGVVSVGIQLSYFRQLFQDLDLGPHGLIRLIRTDGTVLYRDPWREDALGVDSRGALSYRLSLPQEPTSFVATSRLDGIERMFAAGPVGDHPLRFLIGKSTADIEAPWRRKAVFEILVTLLLSVAVLALTLARRRTLRERATAEAQFRLLAENSADMVTRLAPDLTRLYASPAALRVMGRPPEELVGHRAVDHIHPDDRAAIAAAMADLAANGAEAATLVYRVLRPDQPPGTEAWVEGTARAIRDPASGALDGYVVVTRDVTERLRLERERAAEQGELALARDAAEAASRAKSRFLSSMSHELRTPLNVILGFAQVLSLDPGLRETQRDQVDAMQSAGRHLLDMISGILDFSRIEAGQLDLNPSITPLRPLLAECLEMVSQAAGAKQLRLTLDVAPDAPLAARLDPLRLRQILLNLLDNAVKFTPAGSVSLRLLAVGQDQLRLEVADTGHGIAASQRSRLFKDFERLSRGDATVKGSGLGLAISARLAALMGGRLDHADNPGGGSLFWLELPLQPPPG